MGSKPEGENERQMGCDSAVVNSDHAPLDAAEKTLVDGQGCELWRHRELFKTNQPQRDSPESDSRTSQQLVALCDWS